MAGALDGVVVVALEQALAAPLCTGRLADSGARVIKVERAEGDFARDYDHVVHGESAYFVWTNRGKESIALDIKSPADAALLQRMLARADVFIQNLAPGAAARAGFGSADLQRLHPRLITCDITGYGEEGPYRDMKAYDFLVQCETGLVSVTGLPEAPGRVGISVADIACGMNAYAAILEALIERARTGRGRAIAISLFDALAEWMTVPLLHFAYGGTAPGRAGLNHPSIAPYGAYATGDGHHVVVGIQNEREWLDFCARVLGDAAIATDPRFDSNSHRVANRPALDAAINAVFTRLTRDEAVTLLRNARIAFGAVNGVDDLATHPALRYCEFGTPTGTVRSVAPPVRVRGEAPQPGAVPPIDAHGDALRREFAA